VECGLTGFKTAAAEELPEAQVGHAAEEAVAVYRQLTQADRYAGDLARTLSNLGARLFELGRLTEAPAATEQAVLIRRRLAQDNPDRYLEDFSRSLRTLSAIFLELGQPEKAQAAQNEAQAIQHRLDPTQPRRAVILHPTYVAPISQRYLSRSVESEGRRFARS